MVTLFLSPPVLCDSLFFISVSPATRCPVESSMKQLKDMSSALLRSHRCMIRDIAVPVQLPSNIIPDKVFPSHLVVQRCQGICLDSIGSSCIPRKTRLETHNIVSYVNGSGYCSTIQVEHHRGPCRCSCDILPTSCSSLHVFDADSCQCLCSNHLSERKVSCTNSSVHVWDSQRCRCECRAGPCLPGFHQDSTTCECLALASSSCERLSDNHGDLYTVYVAIAAVVVVIVIITATVGFALQKNRTYQDLGITTEASNTKAYTITISHSQDQDLAS